MSRVSRRIFKERTPCVYFIRNDTTGDRYIGSTVDFDTRIGEHMRELAKGKHPNIHLQRAWDKHKTGGFTYGIMHQWHGPVSNEELRLTEEKLMHLRNPAYNISPFATRNVMSREAAQRASVRASKRYVVVDPSGAQSVATNLARFCSDNGLSENGMRSVVHGSSSNHRGWKCWREGESYGYVNRHTKRYVVTDPTGSEREIENLCAFCRENNLTQSTMQRLSTGRGFQHRGWKCRLAQSNARPIS